MINKVRKIALIDGESIRNINPLILSQYESVYYFFGAIQKGIDFDIEQNERELLTPINITMIPIAKTGKDNLDFHLSYYLGKLDLEVDEKVRFYVYAKDTGYDGLITFINKKGRICTRLDSYERLSSQIPIEVPEVDTRAELEQLKKETIKKINISQQQVKKNQLARTARSQPKYTPSNDIKKIYTQLKKLKSNQTPKKLIALENFISSKLSCSSKKSISHIETLKSHHNLTVQNNKINYSKLKL